MLYVLERNCTIPVDVNNATKHYDGITEGSTVIYSCNIGFFLSSGNNSLTCTTGSWNGYLPNCTRKKHFRYNIIHYHLFTVGSTVIYTCNIGFKFAKIKGLAPNGAQ